MLKLSESDIIARIQNEETFECEVLDGSFEIKIEAYVPTVCTAIHAGSQFRPSLRSLCLLDETERLFEEDPHTEKFIQAMPITLIAKDSRYDYDLNRPLAKCIYTKAWCKDVWQREMPEKERRLSIAKHQCFYRVIDALIAKLEARFGAALVFDVHSYNHLRIARDTPAFNVGTEQIDMDRWQSVVDHFVCTLDDVRLDNIPIKAACNDVFFGRGYMIAHINSRFFNTLVIPLEVKKIFMDELRGELYPLVMQGLCEQLKAAFVNLSEFFSRRYLSKKKRKVVSVLPDKMDPAIVKLDRSLYQLAKGLETLHYINPINIQAEKKAFFKNAGNYEPQFRYRPLDIDPYLFRQALYQLPIDAIRDPSIQGLYRSVIHNLSEKVGLLVEAGKRDFLYESLKYYGEPNSIDEKNAQFLLHARDCDPPEDKTVTDDQLKARFMQTAEAWGMQCKVEISNKLVASAMVSNSRRAVMIAKGTVMSEVDARALVEHELGVHMATTLNAAGQKLKVFALGLPGNTLTQEGLAILNEFHSGNMTLQRLKGLAMRVLAVREMLREGSFRHTYSFLREEHRLNEDAAFKLALRVHRGGGFTKDYLYLNGVSRALHLHRSGDIRNLYIGKTGFDYLESINEMVERQLASAPVFYPAYLEQPIEVHPVFEYLMSSIQYGRQVGKAANGNGVVAAA